MPDLSLRLWSRHHLLNSAKRTSDNPKHFLSNAPQTYIVDGRQHILVAIGDTLYAFVLY